MHYSIRALGTVSPRIRGGATDIKTDIEMVRQNRGATGAETSAEGTRIEAPSPHPTRGSGERRKLPQRGLGRSPSR